MTERPAPTLTLTHDQLRGIWEEAALFGIGVMVDMLQKRSATSGEDHRLGGMDFESLAQHFGPSEVGKMTLYCGSHSEVMARTFFERPAILDAIGKMSAFRYQAMKEVAFKLTHEARNTGAESPIPGYDHVPQVTDVIKECVTDQVAKFDKLGPEMIWQGRLPAKEQ